MSAYLCLDDQVHGNPRAMREVEEMRAKIAEFKAMLDTYGEHAPRCAWHVGTYDEPRYCDCGLDEARAALSAKDGP